MKKLLSLERPFLKLVKSRKPKKVVSKTRDATRSGRTASIQLVEEALLKYAA